MNIKKRLYYPYIGCWYSFTSRVPFGSNIYSEDWDVAIILDTARLDAINEIKDEYGFISQVGSMWSLGSSTPEWLINTFSERWMEQIRNTSRISANGFDEYILVQRSLPPELNKAPFGWPKFSRIDYSEFDHLEILYQSDFHDDELGTVPPEDVSKRAISFCRQNEWDRLMIHYIQPHAPYIAEALMTDSEMTEIKSRPMWALRNGLISKEDGWEMYLDNLRVVLDEVRVLLNNLDARKVVITADHGESFGEYGGKFGHIDGYLTPQVRKVPWIETTAVDEQTVAPGNRYHSRGPNHSRETESDELEQHLEDLGYF